MAFTPKQVGVMFGVSSALLATLLCFTLLANSDFVDIDAKLSLEFRLKLLAFSLASPATALLICIGRLANHRFFCAEDIDGSGLTEGTPRARILQSLLQNTLEQLTLAVCIYFLASMTLEGYVLVLIPTSSCLFLVGRILFFNGYAGGAPSRALGFGLTFYPTVVLGLISVFTIVR